jgi:hypothetical protein
MYYCRQRSSRAPIARARSCGHCVRAKTRCDVSLPTCARCRSRGLDCIYAHGSTPRNAPPSGDNSQRYLTDTTRLSESEDLVSIDTSTTLVPSTFESPFAIGPGWTDKSVEVDMTWVPTPSVPLSNSLRLFQVRGIAKSSKELMVPLMMRLLGSYPFMILREDALPPFISPQAYQWDKGQQNASYEVLINCASLVQMFQNRNAANKSFVWRLIRLEQERLWYQHAELDRWGLLASVQALLIYCLLRLVDRESADNDFDISLLATCDVSTHPCCL